MNRMLAKLTPILSIWKYRLFLYYLVWRDIKVRYKNTLVGIFWAFLQPFLSMVVFSFLFGTLLKVNTSGIPYPLFVYTGLLFWNFFYRSAAQGVESIVNNQNLVKKIYFPRILLPLSSVAVNLVDFLFAVLIFVILLFYYRLVPQPISLFVLPISLATYILFGIGVSTFLSTLNVYFRDVRFLVPYALQLLLFLTPIVYPSHTLTQNYAPLLLLNPLAAPVVAARASMFGGETLPLGYLFISILVSAVICLLGIWYIFRKEKDFADIL